MYVKPPLTEEQKEALKEVANSYRLWKVGRRFFIADLLHALEAGCNNSDIARATGISETSIRRFRKSAERTPA